MEPEETNICVSIMFKQTIKDKLDAIASGNGMATATLIRSWVYDRLKELPDED